MDVSTARSGSAEAFVELVLTLIHNYNYITITVSSLNDDDKIFALIFAKRIKRVVDDMSLVSSGIHIYPII